MQFSDGKDPFKNEIIEHLQSLGIKWLLSNDFNRMSWIDMIQDILNHHILSLPDLNHPQIYSQLSE